MKKMPKLALIAIAAAATLDAHAQDYPAKD